MKRVLLILIAALLLIGAIPAAGLATAAYSAQSAAAMIDTYTPAELLQLWNPLTALLRVNGTYPFSELEKGDTGYEVTALQTRLTELGYYQKEIVDNFGNGTYNAMRDFEKANGLTVNGVASAADQQVLYSAEAIASDSAAAGTSQTFDGALTAYTPDELLTQWYQIGALLRANGTYPFVELKKGDIGYEVTALQTQLTAHGYYQKEIIDNFGNGTYDGIHAFEKANGLAVNGVASAADQQVLFSASAIAYTQPSSSNNNNGNTSRGTDATSSATP